MKWDHDLIPNTSKSTLCIRSHMTVKTLVSRRIGGGLKTPLKAAGWCSVAWGIGNRANWGKNFLRPPTSLETESLEEWFYRNLNQKAEQPGAPRLWWPQWSHKYYSHLLPLHLGWDPFYRIPGRILTLKRARRVLNKGICFSFQSIQAPDEEPGKIASEMLRKQVHCCICKQ